MDMNKGMGMVWGGKVLGGVKMKMVCRVVGCFLMLEWVRWGNSKLGVSEGVMKV